MNGLETLDISQHIGGSSKFLYMAEFQEVSISNSRSK
jgi:hypothetical protein